MMEKLFEIISSLIPDEQKADIKAKIDGVVQETLKEHDTEVKRELSKKFGVNLFENDIEKAFTNDKYIPKEVLKTKEEEFVSKLKEVETERDSFKTKVDELNNMTEQYKTEKVYNEVSIKLLQEGFNPQRLEVVKPFVSGENTDEIVGKIKTSLPELFITNHKQQNLYPKKNGEEIKNGWSEHIEAQKRKIKT